MTIVCECMQIALYTLSNFTLNSCSIELNSFEDLLIHDFLILYIVYVLSRFCKSFQFGQSKWKGEKYKFHAYIHGLEININVSRSPCLNVTAFEYQLIKYFRSSDFHINSSSNFLP